MRGTPWLGLDSALSCSLQWITLNRAHKPIELFSELMCNSSDVDWLSKLLNFPPSEGKVNVLSAKYLFLFVAKSARYHLSIIVLTEVDVASCFFTTNKRANRTYRHRHRHRRATALSHGCKIVGSCLQVCQFSTMTASALLRQMPAPLNPHLKPPFLNPPWSALLHLPPSSAQVLCLRRRHLQLPLA